MKNPAKERAFRWGYHNPENSGGDEGIDFVSLHSPWLIRFAHWHTNVCLSPAGRTLNCGFESTSPTQQKTHRKGVFLIVAETKGFEPLIPLPVYHISNVAH